MSVRCSATSAERLLIDLSEWWSAQAQTLEIDRYHDAEKAWERAAVYETAAVHVREDVIAHGAQGFSRRAV